MTPLRVVSGEKGRSGFCKHHGKRTHPATLNRDLGPWRAGAQSSTQDQHKHRDTIQFFPTQTEFCNGRKQELCNRSSKQRKRAGPQRLLKLNMKYGNHKGTSYLILPCPSSLPWAHISPPRFISSTVHFLNVLYGPRKHKNPVKSKEQKRFGFNKGSGWIGRKK